MNISNLYQNRMSSLQEQIKEKGVDLVAIAPSANMTYLIGFAPLMDERFCSLLVTKETFQLVIPQLNADQVETHTGLQVIRWTDTQGPHFALKTALGELDLPAELVLAADDTMRADYLLLLMDHSNPGKSIPAGDLIFHLRMVKAPAEIEFLAQAAALADQAMQVGIESCQPGISERQIARKISDCFNENGAESVDFTIIASGPNGAYPHHMGSDRVLERGDTIVIDIGGTLKGYKSDITRMVQLGDPPQQVLDVHDAVLRANQAGRNAAVPGVKASEVDHAARSSLQSDGLAELFAHRTGHGLGMENHEPPWIASTSDTILAPGMVFSIEPGVYLPGKFGIRIEDVVVVTEGECRLLTGSPHKLVIKE